MSGMDNRTLVAIHRIYETILNGSLWSEALDEVSGLFGDAKATIIVQDTINSGQAFIRSSNNFDLDMLQIYSDKFVDIEAMAWEAVKRAGVGEVTTEGDFFVGAYDRHASTLFLEEHLGIFHRNAVMYRQLPDWAESISIATSRQRGLLNPEERRLLCDISTHLSLATRIARPFTRLKERYGAILNLLDQLAIGVMLLDQRGRVVHKNASMQDVLEACTGLQVSRSGFVAFKDLELETTFKALLASAGGTLEGHGTPPNLASISLQRNGEMSVVLELVPLIDMSGGIDNEFMGFALLAMAPTLAPSLPAGQLGALFSLSPAESQVCDELVAGRSTREIAESRSTSLETVRNQIKSVLQKTSSFDRVNLVRLAFDYAIPLRSDGSGPS